MKTLFDCEKNSKVSVVKLYAEPELKQRFISFGIMKDAKIEILQHTATKSTVEIKVGTMQIALRSDEAKLIEVEDI